MRPPLRLTVTLLLVLVALVQVAPAAADDIQIGVYSQKESRSHASAGGHITVTRHRPGRPTHPARPKPATHTRSSGGAGSATVGGATDTLPPAPTTLPGDSPLLRDASPVGSGSFWYTGGNGASCVYVPNGTPVCYTITQPGSAPAGPATNPATIAATLAARLSLTPGRIQASPGQAGLTATASWFWLDPAPTTRTLTITLAGETITVTASPSIAWHFGDSTTLAGGPGIPYRPGPPPASAITHAYQTRCLPGDHRHNPYVLASCGARGYTVDATVTWRISYDANGPLTQSGALPARITVAGRSFPVTEARAFLTGTPP